ncbi:hypothetical protein [Methylocucumis oryzae]|uniref:Uncharacterized protein n=1 Tax=Methylocucumis oryzae TaxID=1632867 RepID=A0A0F3IKD2_9GAMM|nr:hypothetical protein [Methylocucumis oryzae]KJV07185.1 hypothetical protein VZ94_06420 [Methylocucumis oryzae]
MSIASKLVVYTALLSSFNVALAGTLNNGQWTASSCNTLSEPPVLETNGSIDDYNASIKSINDWQLQAQKYFDCLTKEANDDSQAISGAVNQERSKFNDTVEKLHAEAAASSFNRQPAAEAAESTDSE